MKSRLPAALVIEGNLTASQVLQLPGIAEEFGPVKSGSLRIARRVSNFLRAGYAVATYKELQAARLVLLRLPDAAVERVTAEICAADLTFEDLVLSSSAIAGLRATARAATLKRRGHCEHLQNSCRPAPAVFCSGGPNGGHPPASTISSTAVTLKPTNCARNKRSLVCGGAVDYGASDSALPGSAAVAARLRHYGQPSYDDA